MVEEETTSRRGESIRLKTLKEHLAELVETWERVPIRVLQDGKWTSLYLSEVKNGQIILDWIKSTEGRFWI